MILTGFANNSCVEGPVSTDITIEECVSTLFFCSCEGENAINIDAENGTPWEQTALADLVQSTPESPSTIDLTGRCVAIGGKLLVNNNSLGALIFLNGALRMQPEAEIVVENSSKLVFRNVDQLDSEGSGIHGCDYMWRGITVSAGCTLDMEGSQIEDARHAVLAEDQSALRIVDNFFDNNYRGVYAPAIGIGIGMMQTIFTPPGGVRGNTFEGTTGLLGTLSGDITLGSEGFAGMDLHKVAFFQAGSEAATSVNVFKDHIFGIYTVDTQLRLINADFQNLTNAGVYARRNSYLIAEDNTFDNTNIGIRGEASDLEVENNTMTNLDYGITSAMANSGLLLLRVLGNDITANTICIDVNNARFAEQ